MSRRVIEPSPRVEGRLEVPGDKSITHRALIISAMGHGECVVVNPATAGDVISTERVLGLLGARISNHNSQVQGAEASTGEKERQILVDGRGLEGFSHPSGVLDCGNSGTTFRSMLGVLASTDFVAILDGDASLRRRPMGRVVDPLRAMGAEITGEADFPPIEIRGGKLHGIDYRLPIPSAQVKTALLLAGVRAQGSTTIRGGGSSRDHTERLLEYLSIPIEKEPDQLIIKSTEIQNASSLEVPGDLSSAAFWLVAAAIATGGDIQIDNVGVNPTRSGILDVLRDYGAEVTLTDTKEVCGEPRASVRVKAGDRRALTVGGGRVPGMIDELPLVAVLGAFAEGTSRLHDAAELRVKESDRIAAIVAGLRAMGAEIAAEPDGFTVRGGSRLHGADVSAMGDHRIAMALSIAALFAEGPIAIEGWEAVAISYPGFDADLARVASR